MFKRFALWSSFTLALVIGGCAVDPPEADEAPIGTRQALSGYGGCAAAHYQCTVAGRMPETCDYIDGLCGAVTSSPGSGLPSNGNIGGRTPCQRGCLEVRRGCLGLGEDHPTCSDWYGACMESC
jgi:hypothetical protein